MGALNIVHSAASYAFKSGGDNAEIAIGFGRDADMPDAATIVTLNV